MNRWPGDRDGLMAGVTIVVVLCVVVVMVTVKPRAEGAFHVQELKTPTGSFYGRQIGDKFLTCGGMLLDVGQDEVRATPVRMECSMEMPAYPPRATVFWFDDGGLSVAGPSPERFVLPAHVDVATLPADCARAIVGLLVDYSNEATYSRFVTAKATCPQFVEVRPTPTSSPTPGPTPARFTMTTGGDTTSTIDRRRVFSGRAYVVENRTCIQLTPRYFDCAHTGADWPPAERGAWQVVR